MKKQVVLLAALLGGTLAGNAQKKGFDYNFMVRCVPICSITAGRIRKRWTDCSICIRWIKWKTLTEKDLNDNGNQRFLYPLYPFGRGRDGTDAGQGKDFGKGGSGLPRFGHNVFALPHPPRVFQS